MKKKINWQKLLSYFVLITLILTTIFLIFEINDAPTVADSTESFVRLKSDYALMLSQCILGIVAMLLPGMLENKFKIINENILNLEKIYEKNSFDAIVTNPPYKKENTGITNIDEKKLISRHEVLAKLEDYINISNKLLKDKGEFYMIHRPERLVDILYFMRKYKIEPKEIRFIYSHINDAPKMVLIKGVKNGKAFLKFRENLYIYNEDGKYTDEIYKIYGKEK